MSVNCEQNGVQHCDCDMTMGGGNVENINQMRGQPYRHFYSCNLQAQTICKMEHNIVIVT